MAAFRIIDNSRKRPVWAREAVIIYEMTIIRHRRINKSKLVLTDGTKPAGLPQQRKQYCPEVRS